MRLSDEYYALNPPSPRNNPRGGDVILSGDPNGGRPDLVWETGEQINLSWPTRDKKFYRATNPHSGCWFLSKNPAQSFSSYWEEKN